LRSKTEHIEHVVAAGRLVGDPGGGAKRPEREDRPRGRAVADLEALAGALKDGHLRGAAIDVFPLEPQGNDSKFESPLAKFDNVILTPHSAGHSDGNEERVRLVFLDNLRRWLAGEALAHEAR